MTPRLGPPGEPSVSELERCDLEIAAMEAQDACPAWLVALGIEDWRWERRLIEEEERGVDR